MNTPTFIDAPIDTQALAMAHRRSREPLAPSHCAKRSDVMFVLSSLAVGGSERKIARMANRLKEDGVHVTLACLNAPYTLESTVRRDVPLHKLERRGKFSFSAVLRLRQLIVADRPATVIAVNLYQALYVACATLAAAASAAHRGAGEHLDVPRPRLRKRLYQMVLARFDLTVHGSQAQRRFWVDDDPRAHENSTVIYNGVDSAHFEPVVPSKRRNGCARARRQPGGAAHRHRRAAAAREEPGSAADDAAPPARGACRCSPGHRRQRPAARTFWRAARWSSKSPTA